MLLSGGVDSSVALRLAQEAGLKPRAFYLKIWLEDELAHLNQCPWEEDWAYASAVAKQAGVPLEAVSMQRQYWDRVVSGTYPVYLSQGIYIFSPRLLASPWLSLHAFRPFIPRDVSAATVADARRGRTPNPDILCNSRVKFGMFYDEIGQNFHRMITGHYARTMSAAAAGPKGLGEEREDAGNVLLVRSPDRVKDQTYFLSTLTQRQLEAASFPVGDFQKSRVRELADSFALPNRARKDSQGICFLGKLKWDDFLLHYLGTSKAEPLVSPQLGQF